MSDDNLASFQLELFRNDRHNELLHDLLLLIVDSGANVCTSLNLSALQGLVRYSFVVGH